MPLTPKQRAFLEKHLKVPVLAATAEKGEQKAAKKHDKEITASTRPTLSSRHASTATSATTSGLLQETAETSDDQGNLDKYAKALKGAETLATQEPKPDFKKARDMLEAVRANAATRSAGGRNRALEQAEFRPIYANKVERIKAAKLALQRARRNAAAGRESAARRTRSADHCGAGACLEGKVQGRLQTRWKASVAP
jgi:hypothetical protein